MTLNHTDRIPSPGGGFSTDYILRRPIGSAGRTSAYSAYIEEWIGERRAAILEIREHGPRAEQGKLESLSLKMVDRWWLTRVGNNAAAWMERSLINTAMLLDHRSRRFGRMIHAEGVEKYELDIQLSLYAEEVDFQPLTRAQYHQALQAVVFAGEWQRYLGKLLIRPPGNPEGRRHAFPSHIRTPDPEVKRIIAELAHCRPAGAYFELLRNDAWLVSGGRELCRKQLICPSCHARNAVRLVQRVLEGPWVETRRSGRRLVFVRLTVSTGDLRLCPFEQNDARDALGFYEWLHTSADEYDAETRDETTIRNIDCMQSMEHTLTDCEVEAASQRLSQLVAQCTLHGLDGGIAFHNIGPKGRNYVHELSVVGEVCENNICRFADAFGIENERSERVSSPIECIVFAPNYSDAARLAIAGSSWRFDLRAVGAAFNELAETRAYSIDYGPLGIRGALAWQPLFLLSSVSFWSRWKVLKSIGFKSYRPFGTWTQSLKSDRQHRSATQIDRQKETNGPLQRGDSHNRVVRLQRRLKETTVSQNDIARCAGISPAAVSRFINQNHGSTNLIDRLNRALMQLDPSCFDTDRKSKCRFPDAASVISWLQTQGRNRAWLARQLDCSPSTISRALNGRIGWNREFGTRVQELDDRLTAQRQSSP